MKRIFCLTAVLALAACDKPKYDVDLLCNLMDGGVVSVNAHVYKTHADLSIRRTALSDAVPHYEIQPWINNQIPNIDDTISISLPVTDETKHLAANRYVGTQYALADKIGFWVAETDDNAYNSYVVFGLTSLDGDDIAPMSCSIVIEPQPGVPANIPADRWPDIRNCLLYIAHNTVLDNFVDGQNVAAAWDTDSQSVVAITESQIKSILGDDVQYMYSQNRGFVIYRDEDMVRACDMATRLREYVKNHTVPNYAKIKQCEKDLNEKISRNWDTGSFTLVCDQDTKIDLTQDQALALNAHLDNYPYKTYHSIMGEKEQDACDVLERVNAAIEKYCEQQ